MSEVKLFLRRGRERPVVQGHPWIFSGAVERVEPAGFEPGENCTVHDHLGSLLASGYANPEARIICRVVSRVPGEPWSAGLLERRLDRALALRGRVLPLETDCLRLVNSEGDGLPGVVVDRYGPGLVLQLTTAGAERLRQPLAGLLQSRLDPSFIFENSTGESRAAEHLGAVKQCLAGEPGPRVAVSEYGHRFLVDVLQGQKTGFFLDQRENRRLAARWTSGGARVLNLFAYTGAFSVYAGAAGAGQVVSVESSEEALALAAENLETAGMKPQDHPLVKADAFEYLRSGPGASEKYDLVVIDPPPLAKRQAHLEKACRAYKDLNRLGLAHLSPGGVMLTFSCSSRVDARLFRQVVFAAATEAGRQVRLLQSLGPGPDHPVDICHPEGEYLTGLLLYVC
ncbi:MAG: class I SAM-dependent rRNA methyltransferase [Candidatus Glassbacteria bacterium]|nr:class I SAM-dependent rRNA methyltransferase [Candidatus Glassbacteria bacterium]